MLLSSHLSFFRCLSPPEGIFGQLLPYFSFASFSFIITSTSLPFSSVTINTLLSVPLILRSMEVIVYFPSSLTYLLNMNAFLTLLNFISNLQKDISVLREMIEKVEGCQSVGADPWPSMGSQRHLFIYEVIDASIAFDNLPM